jgi:hypothetical protein
MPIRSVSVKFAAIFLLALLLGGCATTYVPISWGIGEKVQQLSRSDVILTILFDRYDPDRRTLRVGGESFNEVMMPSEVQYHLGAYRQDTKLIYRNLYNEYSDNDLRDLLIHELSHHIWFNHMSPTQRAQWGEHLESHPTSLRDMVRRVYPRPADYDTEDFAFTVEYARTVDIEELTRLNLITVKERDVLLTKLKPVQQPVTQAGSARLFAAEPGLSKLAP